MLKPFVTKICGKGHDPRTGKPVGHQCHIIPTSVLTEEILGNDKPAQNFIDQIVNFKKN